MTDAVNAAIDFGSKKFGFGCMRLPVTEAGDIDDKLFCRMIDRYLEAGFTYFDTAHPYMSERSEAALRRCLVERYPRERFILTDKCSHMYVHEPADVPALFERQLEETGAGYFDIYLIHAVTAEFYKLYEHCQAFEQVKRFRDEGRVRHLGISFHDTPELLERVLTEHPEIEVVQLQFNYADLDNPAVQSKACYDVCERFGKPVIVMEPVKGGGLVNLPAEALDVLASAGEGSPASYAIRFAASYPQVKMVLSGMSTLEQVEDNISYMADFQPLTEAEHAAVDRVREILKAQDTIPCTACHYCTDGCPKHIRIPDLFSCYNAKQLFHDFNSGFYYRNVYTGNGHGKASDCIKCGKCERECPQRLPIRELLEKVAKEYE